MKQRYLILGAGNIGSAIVHYLAPYASVIEVYDQDLELAGKVASSFRFGRAIDHVGRTTADVVINALPISQAKWFTEVAIQHDLPIIDLGGDDEILEWQKNRISKAPIVPGCGLAPGLIPTLGYALWQQDKPNMINLACGGISAEPDDLLGWCPTWSIPGLITNYLKRPTRRDNGRLLTIPSVKESALIDHMIEVNGEEFEYHPTHGGLGNLLNLCDAPNVYYVTLRYPGHFDLMHGILDTQRSENVIRALANPGPDRVVAMVKTENRTIEIDEKPADGFSAMQRLTAISTVAVARLVTEGWGNPGFNAVETVPIDRFLDFLAESGLASIKEAYYAR